MKICNKCGLSKDESEFQARTCMKDGIRNECKKCISERNHIRYLANCEEFKAIQREWNKNNKDIKKKSGQRWYQNNKEKVRQCDAEWAKNNPEKVKEIQIKAQKKYREKNRDKINKNAREKHAENPELCRERCRKSRIKHLEERRKRDREFSRLIRNTPQGKINDRMSVGIRQALKGNKNGLKWESLVGYTKDQLQLHLENLFTKGMTWERLLTGEIHIDHIIPKSSFHYVDPSDPEFKKCWSLDNLQPMWAKDNLIKHNKII